MTTRREKQRRRRREARGVRWDHGIDWPALSQAVHEVVCENTGDDGSGWCLTYAMIARAWLSRHHDQGVPYHMAGGQIGFRIAGRPGTVSFEHFWVIRGLSRPHLVIDLATRHNPALLLANTRAGVPVPAPERVREADFDRASVGRACYVGDGSDLSGAWAYMPLVEPTEFAIRDARAVDPREEVRRVSAKIRTAVSAAGGGP